jgi:hypothetical protein
VRVYVPYYSYYDDYVQFGFYTDPSDALWRLYEEIEIEYDSEDDDWYRRQLSHYGIVCYKVDAKEFYEEDANVAEAVRFNIFSQFER